jgi:hypothetical protein
MMWCPRPDSTSTPLQATDFEFGEAAFAFPCTHNGLAPGIPINRLIYGGFTTFTWKPVARGDRPAVEQVMRCEEVAFGKPELEPDLAAIAGVIALLKATGAGCLAELEQRDFEGLGEDGLAKLLSKAALAAPKKAGPN